MFKRFLDTIAPTFSVFRRHRSNLSPLPIKHPAVMGGISMFVRTGFSQAGWDLHHSMTNCGA